MEMPEGSTVVNKWLQLWSLHRTCKDIRGVPSKPGVWNQTKTKLKYKPNNVPFSAPKEKKHWNMLKGVFKR